MAFNMYSPSNFNMGGPGMGGPAMGAPAMGGPGMGGPGMAGPGGAGGQPRVPSPQEDFQFYGAIFAVLDTEKKQSLNGGQVFSFFLSSKLQKSTLADIWDAVKQNGVLVLAGFSNAMKLITLAQKGVKPELASLNNFQYVGPPNLQYPPNTRLIAPVGLLVPGKPAAGPGGGAKPGGDPFASFGLGLGGGAAAAKPSGKPSGPTWNADSSTASGVVSGGGQATGGKNTAQSSPNLSSMVGQSFPASMSIAAGPGGVGGVGGGNQYGPSAMMKNSHVRQSTRTLAHDPNEYASGDESGALPTLGRATSRRLFEDERSREELRAANQREKMARQQLNDARITNEKLERENEQFRHEIKEARDAQAAALKQSGEALASIQPMRLENEKLKVAIREWQELIQTKDQELEQLESELEELRQENDRNKNEARLAREELDKLQYEADSLRSKLQESENENKRHYREISTLKDEKMKIASEKRDLDIEIVKMQSTVKTLERQATRDKLDRKRESDLFNSFGNGVGSSGPDSNRGGRRSTRTSRSRSPGQKPAGQPVDAMIGGGDKKGDTDLFAGLSHSPVIKEEAAPKDEFDTFGGSPNFPVFNENNPPPPSGAEERIDIGNGAIAPPVGDMPMVSADEDEEMETYEVQEKQMVSVMKTVTVTEMADVQIEVAPGDVENGVYTGRETHGDSEYFLTLKLYKGNKKHFTNSDKDQDGKLNVKEAWEFFQLAKMDAKVLQSAWKLVATGHNDPDLPKDGLAEVQFHTMFQIILTMKKAGRTECPESIPSALQFDVMRMMGQPVVNGKVTIRKTTQVQKSTPTQEEKMVTVKKTRPKKGGKKKGKKAAKGKEQPPPLPAGGDDFGFGNDAPGATSGGGDDFGGGFDDFGGFDDKKKDNKAAKKDDFGGGFGDEPGATPGGDEAWQNFGNDW